MINSNPIKPKTNYRWVVLALIFIVYAVNYADRSNIGAVLPFITDEFKLTNLEAGSLASMFSSVMLYAKYPRAFGWQNVGSEEWCHYPFSVSLP